MSNEVLHAAMWGDVAPLLQLWQMLLLPNPDRSWDVCSGWPRLCGLPHHAARRVAFADLPQAIWEVSARCEADVSTHKGEAAPAVQLRASATSNADREVL